MNKYSGIQQCIGRTVVENCEKTKFIFLFFSKKDDDMFPVNQYKDYTYRTCTTYNPQHYLIEGTLELPSECGGTSDTHTAGLVHKEQQKKVTTWDQMARAPIHVGTCKTGIISGTLRWSIRQEKEQPQNAEQSVDLGKGWGVTFSLRFPVLCSF